MSNAAAGAAEMFRLVSTLPDQLRDSASLPGLEAVAPLEAPCRRLVVCGMGGSAIAGDLLAPLVAESGAVPVVWRDYGLPAWVDASDLVICSSYSGNTEETLSAEAEAARRGCGRLAVTAGGRLADRAVAGEYPAVRLPAGLPPRASLGYGIGALARTFGRLGLWPDADDEVDEAAALLADTDGARRGEAGADPADDPACAALAQELSGRVPVLYTADRAAHAVGARWKAQINENAKWPAMTVPFPELDHNDLVGWCLPPRLRDGFSLIILRTLDDNDRSGLRVDATRALLREQFAGIHEVRSERGGRLARIMGLVQYGDYLSCHLARNAGVDPMPVERIDRLKETLASTEPDSGRR